jgi:tetratricopeptide (TPR) repeat protein
MTLSSSQHAFLAANQLRSEGRIDEAVAEYRVSIAHDPESYDSRVNLATTLRQTGDPSAAFVELEQAVTIRPDRHEAWFNLGNLARDNGQPEVAENFFAAAEERMPLEANARDALGLAWLGLGQPARAAVALRPAVEANPDHAVLWARLGVALRQLDEPDAAVAALAHAATLAPENLRICNEHGNALKQAGRVDDALVEYERGLVFAPDDAGIRASRALGLLATGRIAEGWDEYRWGWIAGTRQPARAHPQPHWDGRRVESLLLWGEQGVGDEVVFASMIPDALTRCTTLVVECEPRLVALFARSFPAAHVVPRTEPPHPATRDPAIAAQAPLGDLPALFRRDLASFPGSPYLLADTARVAQWRTLLATGTSGRPDTRHVGVSWRSHQREERRHINYMGVADLAPLLQVPNLRFVNLQYGDCADELVELRAAGVDIIDLPGLDLMNDLDGVAAAIAALDATVVPGNAVSALAGALGVRTWRFAADNRPYLELGTGQLPWFASVRTTHRRREEGWAGVVRQLHAELEEFGRQ